MVLNPPFSLPQGQLPWARNTMEYYRALEGVATPYYQFLTAAHSSSCQIARVRKILHSQSQVLLCYHSAVLLTAGKL